MRYAFAFLAAALLLSNVASGQTTPAEKLVSANNHAAVVLLKTASQNEAERSVLIPVLSTTSTLWLLENGASPEAREEFGKVWGELALPPAEIDRAYGDLLTTLTKPVKISKAMERTFGPPPQPDYASSFAIWSRYRDDLSDPWETIGVRNYRAERFVIPRPPSAAV